MECGAREELFNAHPSTFSVSAPISAASSSRIADGVREKRGARAGAASRRDARRNLALPCADVSAPRPWSGSARSRCRGLHDLAPVLARLALEHFGQFSFSNGQALRSICASKSASVRPACWQQCVELRARSIQSEMKFRRNIHRRRRNARRRRENSGRALRSGGPLRSWPKNIDISEAAPSHIAASTTWPLPDFDDSGALQAPTTR